MQTNYNERVLQLQIKQLTINMMQIAANYKKLNEKVVELENEINILTSNNGTVRTNNDSIPETNNQDNELIDNTQESSTESSTESSNIKVVITDN